MANRIQPYEREHIDGVKTFNQRLAANGVRYRFPEGPRSKWLPLTDDRSRPFQEYLLSVADDGQVRGGYVLKHQDFMINGECHHLAYYHLPLSEGIIDPAFGMVGVQLFMHALKRHPMLFCLGIGGYQEPLAQMVQKMGWKLSTVPFFFHVNHPFSFLRNVRHLRKSTGRRLVLDGLAFSGAGLLGIRAIQRMKQRRISLSDLACVEEESFGPWADTVWENCRGSYKLLTVRDERTLNILYPAAKARYLRLRIERGGKTIGWVLATDNAHQNHSYFGRVRLGAIVDGLAAHNDVHAVVAAAAAHLKSRGVDLIVSNQSHAAWTCALRDCGFLSGPSNYIFAASKKLQSAVGDVPLNALHLNRGDGDGPIGL